jgi:hypothetical protein
LNFQVVNDNISGNRAAHFANIASAIELYVNGKGSGDGEIMEDRPLGSRSAEFVRIESTFGDGNKTKAGVEAGFVGDREEGFVGGQLFQ